MNGVVTAREAVVEHDGLVAVLTGDVDERFVGGDVDMLFVVAVLHENQPRFHAAGRSFVDGGLQ